MSQRPGSDEVSSPISGVSAALPSDAATPKAADCTRDDAMICERCGQAEMYRMHAVWRCPQCGFKTDCCGW